MEYFEIRSNTIENLSKSRQLWKVVFSILFSVSSILSNTSAKASHDSSQEKNHQAAGEAAAVSSALRCSAVLTDQAGILNHDVSTLAKKRIPAPRLDRILSGVHSLSVLSAVGMINRDHFISGSEDGSIQIWNIVTGEPQGKPIAAHTAPIIYLSVAQDGKHVISGSSRGAILIHEIETGKLVREVLRGHQGSWYAQSEYMEIRHKAIVHSMVVTPDGKYAVTGSADHTILIWNLTTGKLVRGPLIGHKFSVSSVALTSDGKQIISGSDDGLILVHDLATGKQVGVPLEGHTASVSSLAVTSDGKFLISGSYDNTLRIWDLATGKAVIEPIQLPGRVISFALSADGERMFVGFEKGEIYSYFVYHDQNVVDPAVSAKAHKEVARLRSLTPAQAWKETQSNIAIIESAYIGEGIEPVLFSLMTNAIAKDFTWLNGDPGGAKTSLSSTFYKNLLLGLPYEVKKNFFIQMHKLMTEYVITGNPKINEMLQGLYKRNYEDSLVHHEFKTFIVDEVDKSHTGLQAALLSLLAERAVFAGDEVIQAGIETGAFTSNKTIGQLMESYGLDAPTAAALLDRIGIKVHAVNKQLDEFAQWEMLVAINMQKTLPDAPLPIVELRKMAKSVIIPEYLLRDFVQIINKLDPAVIAKLEESKEKQFDPSNEDPPYFPANQFSNRSWRKILNITKASFITEQLMQGVPYEKLRFTMERNDLHHLATSSLYVGPGRIQRKSVEIGPVQIFTSNFELVSFKGQWFPSTGNIILKSMHGIETIYLKYNRGSDEELQVLRYAHIPQVGVLQPGLELLKAQVLGAIDEASEDQEKRKIIESPDGFQEDPVFKQYLALPNIPKDTRKEIESIRQDQESMIRITNKQFEQPIDPEDGKLTKKVRDERAQQLRSARENQREFKKLAQKPEKNITPESLWRLNQRAIQEVVKSFPEMDYVIRAMVMAVVNDGNAYFFGPPGGAKTAIARAIIDAELRTQNHLGVALFINRFLKKFEYQHPREFRLFLLQCHQLMPEGQIIGFQNIEAQEKRDGKLEWNYETSMAGRQFLYAMIDEVEKAHSAIQATLLSMLEERQVFTGSQQVKSIALAIILTSNKTPSEFIEQADIKDQPTLRAVLDRNYIKVLVLNKFAKESSLLNYLIKLENGLTPVVRSPLALNYVKPLIAKVKQRFLFGDPENYIPPSKRLGILALRIANLFDAEQLRKYQESYRAHTLDNVPYYYYPATSGSNRSINNIVNLWASAKIVDQLFSGVPIEELSYEITYKDLGLFARSLIYQGSYEIYPVNDQDGFLQFELNTTALDQLINSGRMDSRDQFTANTVKDEASTVVDIMRVTLAEFQQEHREEIQKYPHLFPEIKLKRINPDQTSHKDSNSNGHGN